MPKHLLWIALLLTQAALIKVCVSIECAASTTKLDWNEMLDAINQPKPSDSAGRQQLARLREFVEAQKDADFATTAGRCVVNDTKGSRNVQPPLQPACGQIQRTEGGQTKTLNFCIANAPPGPTRTCWQGVINVCSNADNCNDDQIPGGEACQLNYHACPCNLDESSQAQWNYVDQLAKTFGDATGQEAVAQARGYNGKFCKPYGTTGNGRCVMLGTGDFNRPACATQQLANDDVLRFCGDATVFGSGRICHNQVECAKGGSSQPEDKLAPLECHHNVMPGRDLQQLREELKSQLEQAGDEEQKKHFPAALNFTLLQNANGEPTCKLPQHPAYRPFCGELKTETGRSDAFRFCGAVGSGYDWKNADSVSIGLRLRVSLTQVPRPTGTTPGPTVATTTSSSESTTAGPTLATATSERESTTATPGPTVATTTTATPRPTVATTTSGSESTTATMLRKALPILLTSLCATLLAAQ